MQFTAATILATLTALAAAAPAPTPQLPVAEDPAYFGLIAIRSGSGVQNAGFSAANSSIFAALPNQGASCDVQGQNFATFYLEGTALYLYAASATPQQLYVDRSGMGQGKLGYTTGAQPTPRNAERDGFALVDGSLVFDNAGLIACPNSIDGAWSIWVSAGNDNPAGNSDCVGIGARAIETEEPVGCYYTS
ncbi:cell wall protein [Phlyctema vagabunda]|uniref:Cell wall protein n=1 Tax=Phlyctema vagabunda TaxID=108571 RepID=A0ABR4P6X1_9HELO